MSAIPTGPINRALTDRERKAVKAELQRLHDMIHDDTTYWRRGLTPPPQARRQEREKQREALAGSILCLLDEPDQPSAPASPAREKEMKR
jgi:hypothetical protein